jgi:hypothetical protein
MNGLAGGRMIFEMRHPYDDMIDEASSILSVYPNAVFVIENCFSLRGDRLLGLARQISASGGGLILSARNISSEAELGKLEGLREIQSPLEIGIGRLLPREVDALIALVDQIAGWRDFRARSPSDRRRFVEMECNGVIPSVLLRLLNSDYVRGKYREEYNKTSYLDPSERQMIIATLLIANIGFDVPLSFISDLFEKDFSSVLRRMSTQGNGLRLVRTDGRVVRTIPSIGARNRLRNVVETRDIVNTNIYILEKMTEELKRTDFEQHMFSQLLRFSIINGIVSDEAEINRFFDHISKISYLRSMPLFWLQWHMAMCAQRRWPKAEECLTMGYTAAENLERRRGDKYNKKQLNDRRAKFLAARANSMMRSGTDLFRDAKEALDLIGRLMHASELTHHPYETLSDIVTLLQSRASTIPDDLKKILVRQVAEVVDTAKKRLASVPQGYQRTRAVEWITQIDAAAKI